MDFSTKITIMKKQHGYGTNTDHEQNSLIEKTLKTTGFLFPETVEEVEEFERIYGKTEVTLPDELQNSQFLFICQKDIDFQSLITTNNSDNFEMAAREGIADLPDNVILQTNGRQK